jgi:flavin reductase (DIM6/NTAB) family NADH-FMN oxidoreductase RutF
MQHDQSRFDAVSAARLQGLSTGESLLANVSEAGVVPDPTGISARAFRDALGHYASGITVITSIDQQGPIGFTCQSFYSVSAEPPLISFSVQKTSTTYPRIRVTGSFAVNVLTRDQQRVSNQFARSGTDKWAGIGWSPTEAGNPVIDQTLMWLDCRIWAEHDAGDHVIVLGKVEEMRLPDTRSEDPLLYFKGRYRQLSAE